MRFNTKLESVWELIVLYGMQERNKDDSGIVIGVNYGVASFLSWSKSICNPKHALQELKVPKDYYLHLFVNTLNGRG